jgi:hypothetical protein
MLRHGIWIIFVGLIVGGCASDGGKTESSAASPSTPGSSSRTDSSSMAGSETVPGSTMSARTPADSNATSRSSQSQNRIAAGVEEETLDTCLARIPQNATVGQRMLAEQTCRRDFAPRR